MSAAFIGASSWVLEPNRAAEFVEAHNVAVLRLAERINRLGLVTPQIRAETHLVRVGQRYLLVAVAPAVTP